MKDKAIHNAILIQLLSREGYNSYEKILCVALLSLANGSKECAPSIKELAELCGCSDRQITRTLKSLEDKGDITKESQYIEVKRNAQTVNKYTLNFL